MENNPNSIMEELSVRVWQLQDINKIVSYFVDSEEEFLRGMGAEKSKLPTKENWVQKLAVEFHKPFPQKAFYYIIWQMNRQPIGHANIDKIYYGDFATMHLHLWNSRLRKNGLGFELIKRSIPIFFKEFQLKTLFCEPYANNIAPNKTLIKLRFEFIKTYETTPGWINFQQMVNRYELSAEQLKSLDHFQ